MAHALRGWAINQRKKTWSVTYSTDLEPGLVSKYTITFNTEYLLYTCIRKCLAARYQQYTP